MKTCPICMENNHTSDWMCCKTCNNEICKNCKERIIYSNGVRNCCPFCRTPLYNRVELSPFTFSIQIAYSLFTLYYIMDYVLDEL